MLALARQIDDLENRSRRNNLMVRGVEEGESKDEGVPLRKVDYEIFGRILTSKCKSIERIHRLGKKISERDRPVILKVADFRDKIKILKIALNSRGHSTELAKITLNELLKSENNYGFHKWKKEKTVQKLN